ncbi:MAG: PHP domain-containing protein, partial [Clostridia bacterium]|nr:PHP domain-containing protein [Clostridia bacterium]
MKHFLIPQEGSFYKANLHCHTTCSDGKQTPEEVKECYKAMGYHAVCFTDHEVLLSQRELCDDEFVALHGYEIAVKKNPLERTAYFMPVYHFNLIAKDPNNLVMSRFYYDNPSFPGQAKEWRDKAAQYSDVITETKYDVEWLNDYIKAVSDAGFLVTYNHPQWSLQTRDDYIGLRGLHGFEIINGGCAAGHNDNTSIHYEQMLREGLLDLIPVAGDDNHR